MSMSSRLRTIKHRIAFVLSRRITLRPTSEATTSVGSHRDHYAFDVSGLRRGLHFIRLAYTSDAPVMGPRLTWDGGDGEREDEVFVFEASSGRELFGTVHLFEGATLLRFHPSRLECQVVLDRAEIRPITEFARNRVYGVPYVQWRMFGPMWLVRSMLADTRDAIKSLIKRQQGRNYVDWWKLYGQVSSEVIESQIARASELGSRPLISVLLPTYRPDIDLLRQAVNSVKAQTYDHWQLCICDDASESDELDAYLAELATDERIVVVRRRENGNISVATNDAMAVATGEYIGFLDHDDTLAPDALFEYAVALNSNPELQIIYSDEDQVALDGRPMNGHFKPDWNYDLLRSINYVCHFLMVERRVLEACGGLRAGYEGAQDFDLLLRLSEVVPRNRIHHVPRVLYHWRAAPGSTAENVDNKAYAADAGVRALGDHLQRQQLPAIAEHSEIKTAYRVRYMLPPEVPSVAIIIPTRNDLRVLKNCIRSIREVTDYSRYEILVVDNDSDEPSALEFLAVFDGDGGRVIRCPGKFNYSALNNRAVSECDAEVVVMLNNDTEALNPEWLSELVAQAIRPEVGAVGAKLLFANDRIQHGGILLGLGGDQIAGHAFKGRHRNEVGSLARTRLVQEYNAVTGACLAVQRTKFEEVGGLDELNLAVAYNDVDFCLRLREAGYVNIWTPYAQLYHFQSYSRGADSEPGNVDRYRGEADYMRKRWGARLLSDRYYNPNLNRGLRNFELAWPPQRLPDSTHGG